MPPRKRATATVELARLPDPGAAVVTPGGTGGAFVIEPRQNTTDERRDRELEEILQEIGSDGRVKVWHVIDGQAAYGGEMSLDGFSLDVLLHTYGGGQKTLVIYQGKERKETIRVSLDPSIPPRNPNAGRLGGATVPPGATTAGPGFGDFATVLGMIAKSSIDQAQQNSQMMINLMTAITAAMSANRGPDTTDQAIRIAQVLKGDGNGPSATAKDMLEIFEKGMNVASKLGGGDGDDGTLSLVSKGLDIISNVVANAPGMRAVMPPVAPPRLPAASTPPASDAGVQEDSIVSSATSPVAVTRPWVAEALPARQLLLITIGNVTPATAASVIADRLSDAAFGDLIADIESGTPDEFIGRFEGYFGTPVQREDVRDWLRQLVAAVVALVEPEPEGDDADGAGSL